MALRFMDSFEHYNLSKILKKWDTGGGLGNATAISSAYGRFGDGIYLNGWDSSYVQKQLDSQATWIAGAAVYFANLGPYSIIGFWDSGGKQIDVRIGAGNLLTISRNGTVLATGTTVMVDGRWYYIEFKATINNVTGAAEIKVDGVSEVSIAGADTQNTANATANQIRFGGDGSSFSANIQFDDIYICDGTGGAPANDYLGDVRVQALFPSGNGNTSNLINSNGNSVNNYSYVDEVTPNDDTDYVESSTVGDKDTYVFGDLTSTSGTVFGVQILPYARKTDAGTRKIASIARHSGTEEDSADETLSATYLYLPDIRETKPGGGSWSISDVNGAEFGVKVTA